MLEVVKLAGARDSRQTDDLAGFKVVDVADLRVEPADLLDRMAIVLPDGAQNDLAQSISPLHDHRIGAGIIVQRLRLYSKRFVKSRGLNGRSQGGWYCSGLRFD